MTAQAFPAAWGNPEQGGDYVPGMTLRDYFAAQALTGLLATAFGEEPHKVPGLAYKLADDMMKLRSEE